MNLHEYQSKEILAKYGVNIQRGFIANTVEEAETAAKKLTEMNGNEGWVVKAQVHANGRGKGGGVKFSPNMEKLCSQSFLSVVYIVACFLQIV